MTPCRKTAFLVALVVLAACGSDDGDGSLEISTLAYVRTECSTGGPHGFSSKQALLVRQGDAAPRTVAEYEPSGGNGTLACAAFAQPRNGEASVHFGAFQRLGINPDGSAIVFEISDDFNRYGMTFLSPEQEGIFFIRADGSGLRRLGRPSRAAALTADGQSIEAQFIFSPNGRLVGFTDLGPGPDGHDAAQVFTLDVYSGERTQVTRLPPASGEGTFGSRFEAFVDDETILLRTNANPEGLNPDHDVLYATVKVDENKLEPVPLIALPGGVVIPDFAITGERRVLSDFPLPGKPVNPDPLTADIFNHPWEVFLNDGTNVLQLTHFRRTDTSVTTPQLALDGRRVYFTASVDRGANPTEACQIFSVESVGGDLRQLTHFTRISSTNVACLRTGKSTERRGCRTYFSRGPSQDRRNGLLLFSTQCDPFETDVNGQQLYAIRPDGTALRQLTYTRGLTRSADGTLDVELPGPWAYGPYVP